MVLIGITSMSIEPYPEDPVGESLIGLSIAERRQKGAIMAFADPQSVTVATVAKSMPRISGPGSFATADGLYSLSISHTSNDRYRHSVQLKFSDVVANPLVPAQNLPSYITTGITINHPKTGLDRATAINIANALVAWATPANITKLVGAES